MRASTARDLPAIGWDPCPGDIRGVRALADDLRALAGRLEEAASTARADAPTWRGEAAERHRARLAALPGSLQCVASSVERLAAVVEGWADELVRWQAQADDLERRTREATAAEAGARDAALTLQHVTRLDDALHGRPPGWTALTASADPVREARAGREACAAEAQALHRSYTDAGAVVAEAMEATADEGLRAPWAGAVPGGLLGLDGLLLRPARPLVVDLWRDLGQDGYGERVRRDAEALDGYADGSEVASAVGLVPLGVTQAVGAGAAASSVATRAQLEYFVDDDPLGALTGVGSGALGLVGLGRGGRAARGGRPPVGTPPHGRSGRPDVFSDDAQATVSTVASAGGEPDAWDEPGHLGTARRRQEEVRARAREEAATERERRRAEDVRRCLGG